MTTGETSISGKKTCFVITPIGQTGSDTRKKKDGLIENCIRPVFSEFDIHVDVADEINQSGNINHQVIRKLDSADIVVANLESPQLSGQFC